MPLVHEAEGVFRLAVHTPLPVEPTNIYVLLGERLGLFDTGIGRERTWGEVVDGLHELGRRPDDVEVVVISHAHVDHHGLAHRFPRADVLVGTPDVPAVNNVRAYMTAQLPAIRDAFAAWGAPDELRAGVPSLLGFCDFARPAPAARGIEAGTVVEGLGGPWVALAVPGHTVGHVCLLRPEDGVLLAGDHLLPTISPNPAIYTEAPPLRSGLPDYLVSLSSLGQHGIRFVLPGHGKPFPFSEKRVEEILAHHEQRLAGVRALVGEGNTVFDVASRLFPQRDFFQVFLAMRETFGHLEVLRERGEVESSRGRWDHLSGGDDIDVYSVC